MKQKRFTVDQIVAVLKKAEVGVVTHLRMGWNSKSKFENRIGH